MSVTPPIVGIYFPPLGSINVFAGEQAGFSVSVELYDQSGMYQLNAGHVSNAGTYFVIKSRGGIQTVVDSGAPDIVFEYDTLKLRFYLDINTNNFLPGDVIFIVIRNIRLLVNSKTYYIPEAGQFTSVIGGDISIQGKIQASSTPIEIISDINGDEDAFSGMQIAIERDNLSTPDYFVVRNVKAFNSTTKTFTLDEALPFTPVAGNAIVVLTSKSSYGMLDTFRKLFSLLHENIWIENTFDGNKHVGSVVELYDSKTNAQLHDGITGLLEKYTLTTTFENDKPVSIEMVKD